MNSVRICAFLAALTVILGSCCWSLADEWRNYSPAGWMDVKGFTLGPDGSIWGFGGSSWSGGVFQTKIDGGMLSWRHYSPYNSTAACETTYAIYADLNGVWIGHSEGLTLFKGLYSLQFTTENSPLPWPSVRQVCGDGAGGIWAATTRGLCRISEGIWTVFTSENSPLPDEYSANAMQFDIESNLLALVVCEQYDEPTGDPPSLYGHPQLLLFDGQQWFNFNEDNSDIPDGQPGDLLFDGEGGIWMACGGEVWRFDGAAWVHYSAENSGLVYNGICDLAMDQEGNIYAVSGSIMGSGLCKFQDGQWVVLPIITRWPYTTFSGVLFDREGDAWVFSSEGYIHISDGTVSLHSPEGLCLLDSTSCKKIIGSRFFDGIYVAGYNGGISKLEGGGWQTWTINNSDLPSKRLIDIAEGPDGALYALTSLPISRDLVGYPIHSLDRFDGSQWSNMSTGIGYFTSCNARGVAVDDDNKVWVAVDGRVLRYHGTFWTAFPIIADQITSVFSLAIEPTTGDVWVGGYGALFRLRDGQWTSVASLLGRIDSIAFDQDGVLWATNKTHKRMGIMSYDGAQGTYYDQENTPLPSSCVSSVAVDSRNVKWFGVDNPDPSSGNNCVASFDGTQWNVYTCENSGLISRGSFGKVPGIAEVAVDRNERIWFGTDSYGISCLYNAGQFDPFPSVEVSVDSLLYSNGDVMRGSIVESNLGRQRWEVNLLLAIMLPDGIVLYFPNWAPSACVFMPQSLRPGTETMPETFLEIEIGDWMPRGQYIWFAALSNQLGEILGMDSVSFTIE